MQYLPGQELIWCILRDFIASTAVVERGGRREFDASAKASEFMVVRLRSEIEHSHNLVLVRQCLNTAHNRLQVFDRCSIASFVI